MGRWGKCIVVSAVLAILGSVMVPAVYLVRFASKSGAVRNEIARIKSEGGPVSSADLAGSPIPDAENAAVLYEKAMKCLETPSARDDMISIRRFSDPRRQARDRVWWAQARAIVRRYSEALRLAREAAAMPKCRFPTDLPRTRDTASRRYYGYLRSLPRLAWLDAVTNAKDGHSDRALQAVELIFRMSESARNEAQVQGAMTRYRLIGMGTDALVDAAGFGGIGEAQARRLYDVLGRIDLRHSAKKALEDERAAYITAFDQMRKGGIPVSYPASDSDTLLVRMRRALPSGWVLNNDEIRYLEDMRDQIKAADSPYRVLEPHAGPQPDMWRYTPSFDISPYSAIRAAAARDQAMARLAGDQIYLGLLAYRKHFGSYPSTLGELGSRLNWRLPPDPFSGKQLVYRRRGRGFVLYSIGEDLKDSGGVPWAGDRPGGFMWGRGSVVQNPNESGDYVWAHSR